MRATTVMLALASAMGVASQSCYAVSNVKMTFYGYPDNDPPGAATAYNCGRNYKAGGTGTFSDPLTFATAPGQYNQCEVIYSSYLKKYLRMEDSCATCSKSYSSREMMSWVFLLTRYTLQLATGPTASSTLTSGPARPPTTAARTRSTASGP